MTLSAKTPASGSTVSASDGYDLTQLPDPLEVLLCDGHLFHYGLLTHVSLVQLNPLLQLGGQTKFHQRIPACLNGVHAALPVNCDGLM